MKMAYDYYSSRREHDEQWLVTEDDLVSLTN